MSEAVTEDISIAAEPSAVMAVITDVGAYPEWQDEIKTVDVLETDDSARPLRARMSVDAKVFTATYTLAYSYTDDGVAWELEESDQLDELTGSYRLSPRADGGTDVAYRLAVSPRIRVPGFLRRQAARRIADGALQGLRRRVEAGG